jgi:GIY-YIG catalytic domain
LRCKLIKIPLVLKLKIIKKQKMKNINYFNPFLNFKSLHYSIIYRNYTKNSNIIRDEIILTSKPIPIKIYEDLSSIKNYKFELFKKGGVYGIINISPGNKQFIGSSVNLFKRLSDHMGGFNSNKRLQRSMSKYGINNFIFVIYY